LRERVGDEELQPAQLVPAQADARQVVAFLVERKVIV